jgi:hypothetical protein
MNPCIGLTIQISCSSFPCALLLVGRTCTKYPQVETGFCFAGQLDERRLVHALEEALSAFPTFCGRLVRESDRWGIRMHPRSGVELELVESSDFSMLPDDAVIQDVWHYSPPLNVDALLRCDDTPVFRMRVIKFSTTPPMTTLGLTSAHLAGEWTILVLTTTNLFKAMAHSWFDSGNVFHKHIKVSH